jgi:hypothetical protein
VSAVAARGYWLSAEPGRRYKATSIIPIGIDHVVRISLRWPDTRVLTGNALLVKLSVKSQVAAGRRRWLRDRVAVIARTGVARFDGWLTRGLCVKATHRVR